MVILSRGGLKKIEVPKIGTFQISALVEHRIDDWLPKECPLCQQGSKRIKPKASDENWQALITSQAA